MQLPKYKKDKGKQKQKICKEPGCGKEYYGHAISKYCGVHSDARNRVRKKRTFIDPSVDNLIFNHHFHEVTNVEFRCPVSGCGNEYMVRVFPKQFIYPKYCEKHRSSYKRIITQKVLPYEQRIAA